MLQNIEILLENSISYHEETRNCGSTDSVKLLSPTLALVTSAASNRASLQSNDECSSSSILSLIDGIVGNDEGKDLLQSTNDEQSTARLGIEDITISAEKVIAAAMTLSQTVMGHEATINSAKDMDINSLGKANDVLSTLEMGDCERIEQYLQGLAVVQRAASIIIDHDKEISASVKEVQEFVKVNRLKSDSIPFLQSAKPVV